MTRQQRQVRLFNEQKHTLQIGGILFTTSELFQVTAPIDQNCPEILSKIDQKLIEN